jgi:transposase
MTGSKTSKSPPLWVVTVDDSPRPKLRDGQKKITRSYKAKLSKAERKAFRSLMWEFRRNPQELSKEERAKLEGLFVTLPQLRTLYEIRVRFQQIFDTAGTCLPSP